MPLRTEDLTEGPAEATVAERVQEGVNSRVEPQEPEGDLVPVMLDASPSAGSADDHQQSVRCPADGKHAHYDGKGLSYFLIPGQTARHGPPGGGGIQFTQTGRGGLGIERASYSQFHPKPPVVGDGDTFPLGRGRFAILKVFLHLPALEPPPAYAEVNAEVEESH